MDFKIFLRAGWILESAGGVNKVRQDCNVNLS